MSADTWAATRRMFLHPACVVGVGAFGLITWSTFSDSASSTALLVWETLWFSRWYEIWKAARNLDEEPLGMGCFNTVFLLGFWLILGFGAVMQALGAS